MLLPVADVISSFVMPFDLNGEKCCFGLIPIRIATLIVGIACLILSVFTGPAVYAIGGIVTVTDVIFATCCVVSSVCLIFGVLKNENEYFRFFIVVWVLDMVYDVIVVFILLYGDYVENPWLHCIIPVLIYFSVISYFISVVYSYSQILSAQPTAIFTDV